MCVCIYTRHNVAIKFTEKAAVLLELQCMEMFKQHLSFSSFYMCTVGSFPPHPPHP